MSISKAAKPAKTSKAKPLGSLEEGQRWWDIEPNLGKLPAPALLPENAKKRPTASDVDAFRAKGDEALANAAAAYRSARDAAADGDDKFMDQMMSSGTLADKVAAMTLRVTQSPVHQLGTVDALLKLCAKGNHRGARLALEALVDLFRNQLLPEDRALIALEARPLLAGEAVLQPAHVVAWAFESALKTRFGALLGHLGEALKDNTADFRKFGLDCCADLLESRPEQESTLLTLVVNKLGDPDRKVASRAMLRLQLLLRSHGSMAPTVVKFTQAMLSRPNLAPRGLYNAIVFLNQVGAGEQPARDRVGGVGGWVGWWVRGWLG